MTLEAFHSSMDCLIFFHLNRHSFAKRRDATDVERLLSCGTVADSIESPPFAKSSCDDRPVERSL